MLSISFWGCFIIVFIVSLLGKTFPIPIILATFMNSVPREQEKMFPQIIGNARIKDA
jgi:hypothetical protein